MQTIAVRAGVATSTVSRALVNHPSIPNDTRQRIQEVARSLGYRPNPLVSALMHTRRSPHGLRDLTTIALLTGYSAEQSRELPYVRRFVDAARKRAESLGYRLESFHVSSEAEALRIDRILDVRGVQGVLVGLFPSSDIRLPLSWERYSFAAIGLNVSYPVGHRAENDQAQAMELALERATQKGYQRIGLIMQSDPAVTTEAKYRRAFLDRQTLSSVGDQARSPASQLLAPLEMPELTPQAFARWFSRQRPDCVLSNHLPVLDWLSEKRRPVGFACVDLQPDDIAEPAAAQKIAGVIQNYEAVGAAAFDLVEGELRYNGRGIPEAKKLVTFEARWKDGTSLG